ncbi:MAG TPA: polysaccharide deacetylase family protein [Chthoniobacteraceae bacterium]|nr:polysaccharide deacetylase family protein [Chthoniobacteraceae bacterium]
MGFLNRKLVVILLAAALALSGCKKIKAFVDKTKHPASATPAAAAVAAAAAMPAPVAAAPAREPAPVLPAINKSASAIVLCYHNIEDKSSMKALTISTAEFEKELQAIKDNKFTVIPMQDFLAFRRGEKDIPVKSCIITLDDGWISSYTNAWPLLKKFGYPFTLFIYVNYVGTGGKSMSWDQLGEMRDAGVDIECHTYSHSNLRAPGGGMDRLHAEMVKKDVATLGVDGWMRKEIVESKQVIEKQLGIKCNAFAYPFGNYNQKARDMVKEAGYEAAFTVYGQQLHFSTPPFDLLGRYAVEAAKPQIFGDAMKMIGGGSGGPVASSSGPITAQIAAVSMVTQPMDGDTVTEANPVLKANLATMGEIDPASVKMRVSGLGQVKAKFDPATKNIEYRVTEPMHDPNYTVIISAVADGKPVETRWGFNYAGPGLEVASTPAAGSAPDTAPASTPAAKGAKPGKARPR